MTVEIPKSRYLGRDMPEVDLLSAILVEANLNDTAILALEGLLLTDHNLDAGQISCQSLVLARCGWKRSEGVFRQLERRFEGVQKTAEAQVMRLCVALLKRNPEHWHLSQAEAGYRFSEPGGASLFLDDPLAAHWHRRGKWGPPIRVSVDSPVVAFESFDTVKRAVDAVMSGARVRLGDREMTWFFTRAGLSRDAQLVPLIRWSRLRSVGQLSGARDDQVAIEVEGCPPQLMGVLEPGPLEFLLELYRRSR